MQGRYCSKLMLEHANTAMAIIYACNNAGNVKPIWAHTLEGARAATTNIERLTPTGENAATFLRSWV